MSLGLSAQTNYTITDNYSIEFSGSKAEGTLGGLAGAIVFDPTDLEASTFNVEVDINTISTGNKTKDKHARGDSWFDAAMYPKADV